MNDFLTFRRMMTPVIIQVIFWIGVIACVLSGIGAILSAGNSSIKLSYGIATLILGPIAVRIFCELLILFFRMNETLTDISKSIGYEKLIQKTPEIKPSDEVLSTKTSETSTVKEEPEAKKPKLQFKTKEEYEKWKAERMKQPSDKDNS
jgi:hypothetical protein